MAIENIIICAALRTDLGTSAEEWNWDGGRGHENEERGKKEDMRSESKRGKRSGRWRRRWRRVRVGRRMWNRRKAMNRARTRH